jgi:hypothetical protein
MRVGYPGATADIPRTRATQSQFERIIPVAVWFLMPPGPFITAL